MQPGNTLTQLRLDRETILAIVAKHGATNVRVFGSVVRGEARPDSDVDLLVEFDRPIGLRFMDLAEYLETLIGVKVDLLTPAGLASIRVPKITECILAELVEV